MQLSSNNSWLLFTIIVAASACATTKKTTVKTENSYPETSAKKIAIADTNFAYNAAQQYILGDANFLSTHVGISIYNPETQQYLYNYQGDKYFVPASNIKLFTCYAAMKNLGDSLVGLRYFLLDSTIANPYGTGSIYPTGDPTFLHPDFKHQPVFDFFKNNRFRKFLQFSTRSEFKPYGNGWAWNDYADGYMPERNYFPIYGDVVRIQMKNDTLKINPSAIKTEYSGSGDDIDNFPKPNEKHYSFTREKNTNTILWKYSEQVFKYQEIPFITSERSTIDLLKDTLKGLHLSYYGQMSSKMNGISIIHSQPTDSLLKLMMHNSDNFFAEQTLLMVSNEKLGVMNDEKIIDTLLKTDFKGLPQKPKWVDGSGLSRYNLITPQDFVWVLAKMKTDFPWQRITTILPTGNEGTLNSYYKNLAGKIFAKTGTLSNQVALSGYLITKQNKTLIFSVLVNNHQTSATNIRRSVEKFLNSVWEQY